MGLVVEGSRQQGCRVVIREEGCKNEIRAREKVLQICIRQILKIGEKSVVEIA